MITSACGDDSHGVDIDVEPQPISTVNVSFDVNSVDSPPPPGFASWEQYIDFVQQNFREQPGLAEQPQRTLNADGTITVIPGRVTNPDGSDGGRWIGGLPNGHRFRSNPDGTVTIYPPGMRAPAR
jgi:hypothetical protein